MRSKKQLSTDANVAAISTGQESVIDPIARASSTESAERVVREKIDIKRPNRLWLIVLLLGWVLDFLFWEQSIGLNFALFSVICLLGGLYFLFAEGYRPAWNSLWLLLPFGFFVVISFIRQEPVTIFLAYIFTAFSTGLLATTYLGGRWFQYGLSDYFHKFFGLVGSMISRPIDLFAQVREEEARQAANKKRFPLWALLRGLLIALPIVACFTSLLASADLVFSQKLGDFFELFSMGKIAEYFLRFLLILFYGYMLAGGFLHTASRSKDEKLVGENKPVIKPFLGFTESAVVLGSVFILFLIFVVIQFQYFFGGETNIGVAGYTYSQYARRGFNELVGVAFFSLMMNLGLSTITHRDDETQKKVYSGLSVGVVGLVMVILVSAYQRLSLAIDWHGFSRLRLYPRVFLIWLGILLVTVVVLEIYRRERYFAFAAVLAALGFAVSLTLMNVDAAVVRHNVPRILQGKNLNVAHLASLSTDAVPALVREYQSTAYSQSVHEGLGAALVCYWYAETLPGGYDNDWRSFNLSSWRAHIALQEVQSSLQDYRINDKRWPARARTPGNVLYECYYYSSVTEE
jgi:hypothetical protein